MGRFLWIIYEGEVEVLRVDEDGNNQAVPKLERKQIFVEMAILTGEPTVSNVVTSTHSKIIRIPREIFPPIIARNPKTLIKMTPLVTKRLLRNAQNDAIESLKKAHKENEDLYDLNFCDRSDEDIDCELWQFIAEIHFI